MAKAKPVYGLDAFSETRYSLPAIFSSRIAELWSWAPHIHDPANVSELHDMRIAAKRLRYCFEFFTPLFGKEFKPTLDTFKKLQDFLGEIHDCDVWVDYLRSELDDAYERLSRAGRRLKKHVGASSGLGRNAQQMLGLIDGGPINGLLGMLVEVCDRRAKLFDDFQGFWQGLEARDFRSELLQAVSRATLARPLLPTPPVEIAAPAASEPDTEDLHLPDDTELAAVDESAAEAEPAAEEYAAAAHENAESGNNGPVIEHLNLEGQDDAAPEGPLESAESWTP